MRKYASSWGKKEHSQELGRKAKPWISQDLILFSHMHLHHAGIVIIPISRRGKLRFRTGHLKSVTPEIIARKLELEIKQTGPAQACPPCPSSGFGDAPGM